MSGMMASVTLRAPLTGWLAPIESVPDPVFAERMMGEGFAIDPIEGEVRAPADATVLTVAPTGHSVSLRLTNGAELLIHVGLETVTLGGKGFTPKVKPGDAVAAGDLLIDFDLDAVAQGAKALITPVVLAGEGYALLLEPLDRLVGWQDGVARITALAPAAVKGDSEGDSHERVVRVDAPHGIHARPAARIAALLRTFVAPVAIVREGKSVNARSTVGLLGLGVRCGDEIIIRGEGSDARAAVEALVALIEAGLGEEAKADHPAPAPVVPQHGPVTAAPGLAIGQVVQLRVADVDVPLDGQGGAVEHAALARAMAAVDAELSAGHGLAAEIAAAHRTLLADPELAEAAGHQIDAGRSAAFAWRHATAQAAEAIRATGDPLLMERVADLIDIERQLIAALLGTEASAVPTLPPQSILIAEDLLPSQFLALDRDRLAGICTAAGGPTSHVAILAASAGIPMLVAAGRDVLAIAEGRTVILDADGARIDADPGVNTLSEVSERIAAAREQRGRDRAEAHADCRMADGTRIEIFANLGSQADAAAAVAAGAEGCGLLRTEFLFLERAEAPDEGEQRDIYSGIATILGDRPLIVRTLDIGGDKPVPYLPMAAEENPALGLRGVRLSLARPDLMQVQLRAILRAVPADQCRIMLPMIADLADYRAVRAMLDAEKAALGIDVPVPLGVMIETPAAAMLADMLAAEADFLSIGTNDLTQYTLAVDRGNAAVSHRIDALHPAVLRLIREVGRGAQRHGRWAGVCGGLASDPLAAPILIGLGITELSATPAAIARLKAVVRTLDMGRCIDLAERACAAESAAAVREMVQGVLA